MKILSISRDRYHAVVRFENNDFTRGHKVFPASVNDMDIQKELGIDGAIQSESKEGTPCLKEPEKTEVFERQKREAGREKRVHEQMEDKRALRVRYLEFLKKKGIDMSGERSFKKIEAEYRKNGGESWHTAT